MTRKQIWNRLTSSLWFRPAGWVILFGGLAFVLALIDRQTGGAFVDPDFPWYFRGGPTGARTVLSIIGGGVLTVTSLTFSIIMVALVQTANAYSPRILSGYLAEPAHQHVLGILVGSFLYCLLVLWEVQSAENSVYVPTLSVTVAILLALLSVAAFIFFIHYVSNSISVGNIVSLIVEDTEKTMEPLFPEMIGEPWPGEDEPPLPQEAPATVVTEHSGYVAYIDGDRLIATAADSETVIRLEHTVGDYVFAGVPLATIWPAESVDEVIADRLRKSFQLSKERTMEQDFLFGIRQLTDIALRALSAAINDPSTAEHCLDALVNLMSKLVAYGSVSPYRCDEDGNVRLIASSVSLAQVLELSFGKIRNYAVVDMTSMLRLIEAGGELGYITERPVDQAALWSHLVMMANLTDRNLAQRADREAVNAQLRRAAAILGQEVEPLLLDVTEEGESARW